MEIIVRIYAILAHPRKDSLTGTLFYSAVRHMQESGAQVDVLDLYDRAQDVALYNPNLKNSHNSFFEENKERFMAADRIFIVYPIFWYAVPGIMKCWMDLITSYAFDYSSHDAQLFSNYAKPKHAIRKALVINSAGMTTFFRKFFTRNSGSEMVKETLKFLGISTYSFYEINDTTRMTPEKNAYHARKVTMLCNWLIKS